VDVDFLNPFVTSVKKSALDTWRRLPPQAQLALPFVATGATTGLIVYKIQGGRLRRQVSILPSVHVLSPLHGTLGFCPAVCSLLRCRQHGTAHAKDGRA
jgi:hypothetical protein